MQQGAVLFAQAEHRFRSDLWGLAPAAAVTESGIQMQTFGPVLATVIGEIADVGVVNLIQGATEPGATAEGFLEEAVDWMADWKVDYLVPVPTGRPESGRAEAWLSWHGFEQSFVLRRYQRPAVPLERFGAPPSPIMVEEHPACEDEEICYVATHAIGLPALFGLLLIGLPCLHNWHCYLALIEDEVAATGSTMIDNGIATFGLDGILPRARNRGCQMALLERRVDDAAADPSCEMIQAYACDSAGYGPSTAARNLHRLASSRPTESSAGSRPCAGGPRDARKMLEIALGAIAAAVAARALARAGDGLVDIGLRSARRMAGTVRSRLSAAAAARAGASGQATGRHDHAIGGRRWKRVDRRGAREHGRLSPRRRRRRHAWFALTPGSYPASITVASSPASKAGSMGRRRSRCTSSKSEEEAARPGWRSSSAKSRRTATDCADQVEKLVPLLRSSATESEPVRLLLLVRTGPARTSNWSERLGNRIDSLDVALEEARVQTLEDTPLDRESREELFEVAPAAFADRLKPPDPAAVDAAISVVEIDASFGGGHHDPEVPAARRAQRAGRTGDRALPSALPAPRCSNRLRRARSRAGEHAGLPCEPPGGS
jgi:hypothetical protein